MLASGELAALASYPDGWPEALRRAANARTPTKLMTGEVEWLMSTPSRAGDSAPSVRFCTSRFAFDRVVTINHGDEQGVVFRNPDGQPSQYTYTGPIHSMTWEGDVWTHTEKSPLVDVIDSRRGETFTFGDFRQVGLNPTSFTRSLDHSLAEGAVAFSSGVESGLHVVTAIPKDQAESWKWRWWIDPAKDWSVVRTGTYEAGKLVTETVCTVEPFEGSWFPRKVEVFGGDAGDGKLIRTIEVIRASFNRPDQPPELTPKDIGVEIGMNIRHLAPDRRMPLLVWDGQRGVAIDEFSARLASGELSPGAGLSRERRRLAALDERRRAAETGTAAGAGTQSRAEFETEWERYTREFIAKFGLDSDQQQRAWSICRDCQERGRTYADTRRSAFAALAKDEAELKQADARTATERRAALAARRLELLAPLQVIFDTELRPRLDQLPTRAQREAVEQATRRKRAAP